MSPQEKYRLAYRAMQGDKAALEALGNPSTLGELDAIMRDGFDGLTDSERADDLRNVESWLRGEN